MSAGALEASNSDVPEFLTWDELQRLPDEVAGEIELWDRRVIWNRRGPRQHQRFMVRMRNALESSARRAMRNWDGGEGQPPCWEVEVETDVFFNEDKSSFLTPDFLIYRCLPRDADVMAADVVLVGEVLSGSDTPKRRTWKMDRYAEAGIPWYWEIELDAGGSWDVSRVLAYELVRIPTMDLPVKPLRPLNYLVAGEWEPTGEDITFPEPFPMKISWGDLAF